MNPRFAEHSWSAGYCAVIVILGLALIWLSYTGAVKSSHSVYLSGEALAYQEALISVRAKKAELERARRFMETASGFVAKAERLGMRSINAGLYRVDYDKVVSLQKMPEVLLQARNEPGRYFLPETLSIARAGVFPAKNQAQALSNAVDKRGNNYRLAFVGNVFIVNNEN